MSHDIILFFNIIGENPSDISMYCASIMTSTLWPALRAEASVSIYQQTFQISWQNTQTVYCATIFE
jgi:hypothetical protein